MYTYNSNWQLPTTEAILKLYYIITDVQYVYHNYNYVASEES